VVVVVQQEQIAAHQVATPYSAPSLLLVVALDQQVAILAPERYQVVLVAVEAVAAVDQQRLEPPVILPRYPHHKEIVVEMDLRAARIMAAVAAEVLLLLAQTELRLREAAGARAQHRPFLVAA
jgi:hypothetical protein